MADPWYIIKHMLTLTFACFLSSMKSMSCEWIGAQCSSVSQVSFVIDGLSVLTAITDTNRWAWTHDILSRVQPPRDIHHLLFIETRPSLPSFSTSVRPFANGTSSTKGSHTNKHNHTNSNSSSNNGSSLVRPDDVVSCRGLLLTKGFRVSLESEIRLGQHEKWCITLRDLGRTDQMDVYIPIYHGWRAMLLIPGSIIWIQRAIRRMTPNKWKVYLECNQDTCITVMTASSCVPSPIMPRSITAVNWGGLPSSGMMSSGNDSKAAASTNKRPNGDVSMIEWKPLPVIYLAQLSPWPEAGISLALVRIKCRLTTRICHILLCINWWWGKLDELHRIVSVYSIELKVKCDICQQVIRDKLCKTHPGANTGTLFNLLFGF
jgi:hypothetical protein